MFTLVPSQFFDPATRRDALAGVCDLKEDSEVRHIEIPQYDAVLVYSLDEDGIDSVQEMVQILSVLPGLTDYNKLLCSLKDGLLTMAVAQGKTLLLANSFATADFTTAEYYIFLVIKSLQINPEMSTICWLTELKEEEKMSLYRYFKAVVNIKIN